MNVSIIIPIYNVEQYLRRCLDSLCNQTLTDIEIICIDDCSTDNSLNILKEYQQADSRVKIIELKENSGAAIARNKGLEIAQGEYLGFVDSDDEVDLNFYEELYKKAKETGAEITKANCKYIDYDGKSAISSLNEEIKKNKYSYLWQWWCSIYKTDFIKTNHINFPDECIKGQDSVFLAKAVVLSNKIEVVDNVFYHYFRREDSLDAKILSKKAIKSFILCRNIIFDFMHRQELNTKDRGNYAYLYLIRLLDYLLFSFRTNCYNCKNMLVTSLIDNYQKCLDKEYVDKHFPYQWMLLYIKNNEREKLTKILSKYKKESDLIYSPNILEKVFSIKVNYFNKRKIITILGIKFKIKLRGKEED